MAGTLTLDEQSRQGPWDEMIGRSAGSYRVVKLLGKGGMGAVYLAKHPGIGSSVAVKFLHPRFCGDPAHVERFFNEARAVNLIGHENIVKTLDFAQTPDGRYYFVMEHLNGAPLSSLPLPVPLAVAGPILLQICRALQAAHERQIVHRDLKPDNVFLISQMGRKNFVKLVDFGIAKLTDPQTPAGLTEAGALIGTPEYMSPEQAAGRVGEVGRRSDVYSLGVLMYQLATGRVPFRGASTAETLVKHMQEKPPPLDAPVPPAYAAIILRALEKEKSARWQSMGELHDAIAACMKELGISADLPPADPGPAPQSPSEMPQTDPRAGAMPLTGTYLGDPEPVKARVDRLADWALAPARRLRTLALVAAAVAVIVVAVRPSRRPEPQAVPPNATPAPARPAPISAPARIEPPPPKPVEKQAEPPPMTRKRRPSPATAVAPKPTPKLVPPGPLTAADAARAAGPAARARAEIEAAAAKSAADDKSAPALPPGVRLFAVSDPLGATVTAAWNGKSAAGHTPFVFRVRRGARVTVTFSKPGFAPEVREIEAAQAQAVSVELKPSP
ncbi:MAG TPA: serine/threonine-protein kinase [Myxococcales bacterium]|nr:serine/threonine-protein kinase [Myxococcales bacterium]